ncbi:hypothetical protein KNE206_30440 [Kitasatospora sp. NE20-6]|uniref:ATP-binding protein n=1 Tax=Kitasatospora sp. NE20-6 TaxID=2859066 RepID=UPI0034DB7FAB
MVIFDLLWAPTAVTGVAAAGAAALWLSARRRVSLVLADRGRMQVGLAGAEEQAVVLRKWLVGFEAELDHFVAARLPVYVSSLEHPHLLVPGPVDERAADGGLEGRFRAVLEMVGKAVTAERANADFAGQAVARGAAQVLQSLGYRMQDLLVGAQERFADEEVAAFLLAADALNEQALRRAQATAVACGAPVGLSRDDSPLVDLVVGARSRVEGYGRLRVSNHLSGDSHVGVVARAAEPVAMILAELMANGQYFSAGAPDVPVEVGLYRTATGAAVVVEDAGLGMNADDLRFVARMLSGGAMRLTDLGDPPRSGFAAVGRLCRPLNIGVELSRSRFGGTCATVHIPGDLLVALDPVLQPASVMAPRPVASVAALPAAEVTAGASDLPHRRRRRPADGPTASVPTASPPPRSSAEVRDIYGGLQRGTTAGRAAAQQHAFPDFTERPNP